MPRKKKETEENLDTATTVAVAEAPESADQIQAETPGGPASDDTANHPKQQQWARTFKSVLNLPAKGVMVGRRDGHDWVIGFPEAPSPEIKQQLSEAGFSYRSRDKKWTTFTHAPNRPQVESLAKKLRAEFGDDIFIADYPVKQVVLAFESKPADEVTVELKDKGFHYRPDQTWNADYTPATQDIARDIAQSMPEKSRSVAG